MRHPDFAEVFMKIRRAVALAAATAVIAPATLLAAPAAYATSPTPSASESESKSADPSESATTPSDNESSPANRTSQSASASASASESASTSPSASASASESASSPAPSSSSTAPTRPAEPPLCDDTEPPVDKNLQVGLSGLPSKIVAGSGFKNFKLNVANKSEKKYERVDLGVFTAAWDDDFELTDEFLTLQFKDPETGAWTDISSDDETAGYLGYTDIRAKESFSIDLRLSVAKAAPAGSGIAITVGVYADAEGNCVIAGGENLYEFDILAAGSKPGDVNEAKPQGGKKPLPPKPSGNTQINPQGNLAETGSSSVLPTIGIVGGIAVVAGAGVVFAMKRRRGDATA
ncbi:hypothetical protein ACWF94_20405 [Streptomyces sp. NPDC055078]